MRLPRFARQPAILACAVLGLWASPDAVLLGSARAQTVANQSAVSPATAPIQALDEALLGVMKQGHQASFKQRYETLAPAVDRALDLPFILRISVGVNWASMSAAQQQQLLAAFRDYTIASYVDNFDSYDGQTLQIVGATRQLATGEQVVSTEIIPKGGEPHKLDYVMHRSADGQWKAIDVLADGTISRVAVQRSDWTSLLASGGAPALLATLQKKTEALSQG